MSDIEMMDCEDGSAVMVGPFGAVRVQYFNCDVCGNSENVGGRWVVRLPRPSTGELCDVMWTCAVCAPEVGAVAAV